MNQLKEQIIDLFHRGGADIVRFGAAARFSDPALRLLMPEAQTVIGAAFRQLRGTRRGIEEGSTYYQYTTNAVEVLEENIMPRALLRVSSLLERNGYEALPQRRNQLVMESEFDTAFEMDYKEVYRGKTAEHQLDFEQCAVACGIGERGLSGSILTDEFGPLVRYVFLLTDAEFPDDGPAQPHLCDHCGKCIAACPGHAIDASGKRDNWQCSVYYNGANMSENPFMPPDALLHDPDRLAVISGAAKLSSQRAREVLDELFFYPTIKQGYRASICGRKCDTTCYIHLEERGVLTKTFRTPFRKRPEWKLPMEPSGSNLR